MVGIDGSPGGMAALGWAAMEAQVRHRPLSVYHCWQLPVLARPGPSMQSLAALQEVESAARLVLGEAMAWLRREYPAVTASVTALRGPAGRRLVAQVRQCDLLVLGLGTRHRFTARVLGSTVEHALRRARGTVAVVPPPGTPAAGGPFAGHVIAAVDDSDAAGAVVGTGFAEAATHGWPLAVVHADPHAPAGAARSAPRTELPRVGGLIESWHARYPQVTVHRDTLGGAPGAVLEWACAGARLVVVGGSSHPNRLLRLTDVLLSRIDCPVVVPPHRVLAAAVR